MAYSVTRRSGEIAVRMALGAARGTIVRMILTESLTLLLTGFALSAPAIYGGSKAVSVLLFGLESGGWAAALAGVAALFTAVAVAAVARPAYRAATLNPLESLKEM
jgi:ABC-type antimicrobial peptide transport system permease subunit